MSGDQDSLDGRFRLFLAYQLFIDGIKKTTNRRQWAAKGDPSSLNPSALNSDHPVLETLFALPEPKDRSTAHALDIVDLNLWRDMAEEPPVMCDRNATGAPSTAIDTKARR